MDTDNMWYDSLASTRERPGILATSLKQHCASPIRHRETQDDPCPLTDACRM